MGRRWENSVVLQDLYRIRTGDLYNANRPGRPFRAYQAAALKNFPSLYARDFASRIVYTVYTKKREELTRIVVAIVVNFLV